jgi:type I restriction enzyme S subunit
MTFNSYYDLKVKLPDLSTQKSIAKVLSDLDTKIELNNRINRELEAMAKTLYDYWFVQFDFPNELGKPYKTNGGKMVWNKELKREIPEGWENGNLEDIGTIIGGSTPSKENSEYFSSGESTPWITPKDLSMNKGNKFITRGEFDVTKSGIKTASLKIMPKGTVLLSSRAPIGYLAISREKVTTNQGFKSFVPDKGFSTYFIFYTVQKMIPTIINNAVGSTFKEVSGTTLKSIKIPIPVKSILEVFDEKVSSIFKRQDLLELENQQLSELRDWLLPMLMNGQVRGGE